jgi:hypothetical protein
MERDYHKDLEETDSNTIDRFNKKYSIDSNGCHIWIGSKTHDNYGQFWYKKRLWLAHRAAYEIWVGKIPEGMTIDHICENTLCVNPNHLQVMTLKENILKSNGISAIHARKTHCINGHLLSDDNVRYRKDTFGRQCRECKRINDRKYRAISKGGCKHEKANTGILYLRQR